MKREIWDAEHKCISCSSIMNRTKVKMEGMEVRAWICKKCNETVLHSEDAQRMLIFNKLKKGIPVKIGKLGNSLVMRVPKQIADFYKISQGEEVTLKAENIKKLELVV